MANSMFKIKKDIDRHGPRLMHSNCKHLDPPYFSLPTTFKPNKFGEIFSSLLNFGRTLRQKYQFVRPENNTKAAFFIRMLAPHVKCQRPT